MCRSFGVHHQARPRQLGIGNPLNLPGQRKAIEESKQEKEGRHRVEVETVFHGPDSCKAETTAWGSGGAKRRRAKQQQVQPSTSQARHSHYIPGRSSGSDRRSS